MPMPLHAVYLNWRGARGRAMATETGNTRTIRGYVTRLLEYPRWVIEREVDFTHCRSGGHFNEFLDACSACQFGAGCRWLDRHRTPSADEASIDDLVQALESAVTYFGVAGRAARNPSPETRDWLREAQRFLGSHHG